MNRKPLHILVCMLIASFIVSTVNLPVYADSAPKLTVSSDAAKLANTLLNENSGLSISNALFTGVDGTAGIFSGAGSQVGFDSGIVLSTGFLKGETDIFGVGYQTMFDTQTNGVPASGKDYTYYGFPSNKFNDLACIEFDLNSPQAGNFSFQYCMASEEYPNYIDTYPDQFMLNVNGTNYALIPGTNTAVSIGTVNHKTNSNYYKGIDTTGTPEDDKAISTTSFVFNGETTVFSVSTPVKQGTNHIILSIADYGDHALDSAVFIKAGSIKDNAAKPGIFKFGSIQGNTLNILRDSGSDGFAQVDVQFIDAQGSVISTSTLSFNDGQTTGSADIPKNAVKAVLKKPVGGAAIGQDSLSLISAPGSPTNIAVTVGDGAAAVSFTPPTDDGNSPITGYIVTATPVAGGASITAAGTQSPITVNGLQNGTAYTISVAAQNSVGVGAATIFSSSVTPAAPQPVSDSAASTASANPKTGNSGMLQFPIAVIGFSFISIAAFYIKSRSLAGKAR